MAETKKKTGPSLGSQRENSIATMSKSQRKQAQKDAPKNRSEAIKAQAKALEKQAEKIRADEKTALSPPSEGPPKGS